MKNKLIAMVALVVVAFAQPTQAAMLNVASYTSNSVVFSISGQMPTLNPGTLADGPQEIDIQYSGNLADPGVYHNANALTAVPFNGAGALNQGNTGGANSWGTPTSYSWMFFNNDLTGLFGTGSWVTLTWDGLDFLNTTGTGSFDLYWGNLTNGPDVNGIRNILLGSVDVVRGQIVDNNVPEPASLALLGIGIVGLAMIRRRKQW